MSLKGAGYIVGAYEHPTRRATDKSVALLHTECPGFAVTDNQSGEQREDWYEPAMDRNAIDVRISHVRVFL